VFFLFCFSKIDEFGTPLEIILQGEKEGNPSIHLVDWSFPFPHKISILNDSYFLSIYDLG
jgi:hypothetical protein